MARIRSLSSAIAPFLRYLPSRPVEFILTAGQDNDLTCGEPLLKHADPGALNADKAYDADAFIEILTERQITPVIPSHPRPQHPIALRFCSVLRA